MTTQEIERLKETGERLTYAEASKRLYAINERGEFARVIYHLAETDALKAWAQRNGIKTDSQAYEDERTYCGGSDEKAFKSGMGGYSIFAQCLADIKRGTHGTERIERLVFDYVIIDTPSD